MSNENDENAIGNEVAGSEVEVSPHEEANDYIAHEATTIEPTTLSEKNEKTNGVENYATEPAAETSPPVEDVDDGKDEATHTETKEEPLSNEKALENDAKADNGEKTQDGSLHTETKEKDERDSNSEPDAVELDVVPRDEAQVTNTSADIGSRDAADNDSNNEKLNEEIQTPRTGAHTSEQGANQENAEEVFAHEPIRDGNLEQGDVSDTLNNREATALETLHPAGTTQEVSATDNEAKKQKNHSRSSEDPVSPDSAPIVETEEGNAEPILAAGEENGDEEGQGDMHLEDKSGDNEDHSDSLRHHPREEGHEIEGTEVPEQEQQESETDVVAPNMGGEKAGDGDTRESADVFEVNVEQETAAETTGTRGDIEEADISEGNAELEETAMSTDSGESTEQTEKSDANNVEEEQANAKELRDSTNDVNQTDANAKDAVKSADPNSVAEETETDIHIATTDRASPTTDADTSRTEEDSAFADGTCTSTPSPATSRAELTSPKDLLREGENLDEGILADEPPATRGSQQDRKKRTEKATARSTRLLRAAAAGAAVRSPKYRCPSRTGRKSGAHNPRLRGTRKLRKRRKSGLRRASACCRRGSSHRRRNEKRRNILRLPGPEACAGSAPTLSYKIMIAKVLQEIEDLKRRLEYTRITLGAEVRLRTHAEREVKNLREDLLKKKIQVTLTKKETQSVMAPFLRDSFYFVGPI
ncbi:hypothetical protein HPB49_000772 [Dermacentor silvarum]|uniref:Uncharacterized protein n=1 Tax=Dermacentor silvarum TaxID=543639 RepID=A0ACB8DHU3_DERSI|nr:hypothetical protein HPB49_000772 [Dermacentor silvarum]